jgi:O-acetyl-ADP-ribose deacetylase (regulator of RNase III)
MGHANSRRSCFVIMPYGKRKDADGNEIDFDLVYRSLIEKAIEAAGFVSVRCDEIQGPGSIQRDMFEHIARDELAVVDISTLNPNVFYELGVRHALRPSVTVLIKNRLSSVPFNIYSERVIDYPGRNGSYREPIKMIQSFLNAGLKATAPDSPIFTILQDARKDWRAERIPHSEDYVYRLIAQPAKRLCIATGDLRDRRNIDVWVNSENTNMQMARFYDRALSAIIRYEGARKNENGEIVEDVIAAELRQATQGRDFVTPGAVYVTSSGDLARTRGVKKIFHAAAVTGVPGAGYVPISEVERIVTTVLTKMDEEANREAGLRTVAFPMLGTGVAGADVRLLAPRLLKEAITYLKRNPESRVETVYFMAWNYRDLDAGRSALDASPDAAFTEQQGP